jgi:hypothetical protein
MNTKENDNFNEVEEEMKEVKPITKTVRLQANPASLSTKQSQKEDLLPNLK